MPSRKNSTTKKNSSRSKTISVHVIFLPLLTLTFVLWLLYRYLFSFPVWFDETIGKALFFGLPVWVYVTATQFRDVAESFALYKLKHGVLMGLLVGGLFGFATSLITLLQRGGGVEAVLLFDSPYFWYEFFLSLCTAFWETLLFYSFCMMVILRQWKHWGLVQQVVFTAFIFLLFHIPNTLLRYPLHLVAPQLLLLFLFAIGQALLFVNQKNAYSLVFSHAIWGMVLLTHTW